MLATVIAVTGPQIICARFTRQIHVHVNVAAVAPTVHSMHGRNPYRCRSLMTRFSVSGWSWRIDTGSPKTIPRGYF